MDKYQNKLAMMIGLAVKAGAVYIGIELACNAARGKKARLFLISESSSDNTKKKAFNCAGYYNVEAKEIPLDTEALGKSCGKKSAVGCIAISDNNFVAAINNILSRE